MDISDWRKQIDHIDRNLVQLLNERARCAVEIGKLKRQIGRPIVDLIREEEVLRQVFEANDGPLSDDAIRRIFESIVREGRGLEHILADENDPRTSRKP